MLLKLENKYDTVNKTYFKEMKYVDRFSWNKYNGGDDELLIPFFVGTLVFVFMGVVFHAIAFVFSFIFLALLVLQLFNSTSEEYKELNSSYLVQLEGDEKPKYYSKWYLDIVGYDLLDNKNLYTIENVAFEGKRYDNLLSEKIKLLKSNNCIISRIEEWDDDSYYKQRWFRIHYYQLFPEIRPKNRKHWKNNIPENRILTWSEHKKYKKGKLKQQELLEQAEYIKEFKEYYGLEVKEIDEIIK